MSGSLRFAADGGGVGRSYRGGFGPKTLAEAMGHIAVPEPARSSVFDISCVTELSICLGQVRARLTQPGVYMLVDAKRA